MENKKELLLEIGCEEIPSTLIISALEKLEKVFRDFCAQERIEHGAIATYATPRRLTLIAGSVSDTRGDVQIEIKGPPASAARTADGAWTPTAEKFAAGRNAALDDLVILDTPKGPYVHVVKKETGGPVKDVLPTLINRAMAEITFPRSMRWDVRKSRFARPVRWFLFLFGGEVITADVEGIPCGNVTYGNRYFGSDAIAVGSATEYFEKLRAAGVIVDHNERRELIRSGVLAIAGGKPHMTDELLEDNNFLVEFPYLATGRFNDEFAELPAEVLTVCIEKNQHYFPVFDAVTGRIIPKFVVVMNVPLTESKVVMHGYERVLYSRLKDARFFFDEDVKRPLPERIDDLKKITFQQQLGSMYDKAMRVRKFAGYLSGRAGLGPESSAVVQRAAELMKADLTTQMVFEYTEIQGTVGKHYALHAGESAAVAAAVEGHYMPRYADDDLPQTPEGAILAIADKMDTVAGYFAIGLIPQRSMDPYQLRRQVLGVIRILDGYGFPFTFDQLAADALGFMPEGVVPDGAARDKSAGELLGFFRARFNAFMESLGFAYDVVNAIDFGRLPRVSDAREIADALTAMRSDEGFAGLHEVFTRISNILAKSAKGGGGDVAVDESLFESDAERALLAAVISVSSGWAAGRPAVKDMIAGLFAITKPATEFFDGVLVMAEDAAVRANRIALLTRVRSLYLEVADFKQIVLK